jgi:hypothetical protein
MQVELVAAWDMHIAQEAQPLAVRPRLEQTVDDRSEHGSLNRKLEPSPSQALREDAVDLELLPQSPKHQPWTDRFDAHCL